MPQEKGNYSDYWEEDGAGKTFSTPFQMDVFKQYVLSDAEILDVGCGYGRLLHELSAAGYKNIKGAEPSDALRRRYEKEGGVHEIHTPENGLMPFSNNSFDAVILVAVLTSIPDEKIQSALISDIYRVLVPGGILYINDFLLNFDERNIERYKKYEKKHGIYGVFEVSDGGILKHHTDERVHELIRPFEGLVFEKLVYTTMNGNRANGFYYLGRK